MTITLLGEPKSTSHIYHMTCRGRFASMYMTKQGKELKESYQWQIRSQFKEKPLLGAILLEIRLFHGTKRKCDWDNFHKLSMDAMNGLVFEDDSQVVQATVTKGYDKENPRIEVTIEPIVPVVSAA